ncbi:hypothetical protein OG413_05490 [Streptomyces sp. NBC_01433]|uniref:hypothetical protein n=1 Tax=Streptomyces sp. NBC_01433 TaxID=2903864 RepID=UPI00224CC880|nr:hypothetical protein [Streptomyces sp. NBC_01433]MCX4674781.1 hypothetical protein [Streptomyces sp. NBC_01433]
MTQSAVPRPSRGQDDLLGKPPVPPAASEACRLLCAGVYLHDGYRDAVIDQLYVQEERIAAPSTGFDAARVLAHALRARRAELWWAAGILCAWLLGVVLTRGGIAALVMPCVLLALAPLIRGSARNPPVYRRIPAFLMRWYGRLLLFTFVLWMAGGTLYGLFGDDDSEGYGLSVLTGGFTSGESGSGAAWGALAFFALIAALVGLRRGQFARVMAGELARKNFADLAADPAEHAVGGRFRRLQQRIRLEQHAPLIMYSANDPFCGAGVPYHPWNLAVELRPSEDGPTEPIDNARILRRIVPLLEALRVPSAHGSPEAADAVRDRLRELLIDECVFLPVVGMPRREDAPYGPQGFETHRLGAVEEGGESRRHFLRIRVGGWNEEVVVTVFVRVHTQGGMLMLELAPHVLMPVHPLFQEADRTAHRHRNNNWFGKAAWAVARTPGSLVRSVITLGRGAVSGWTLLTAGNSGALPDGPAMSIRQLGADDEASLFQDMDINRYLKSIQDRVTGGVRLALREAGWQTDEFEQKVVNIGAGGVFIESAKDSAIGIGDHNAITHTDKRTAANPNTAAGAKPGTKQGPGAPKPPPKASGPGPGPAPRTYQHPNSGGK